MVASSTSKLVQQVYYSFDFYYSSLYFRKQNILCSPVFSETEEKPSKKCLEDECKRMNQLIHDDHSHDSDYHLLVCYLGHGGHKVGTALKEGSWIPNVKKNGEADWIAFEELNKEILSIRDDCVHCTGSCV